jgi:hypothetical protein
VASRKENEWIPRSVRAFGGDESVLAVRVSHGAPGCDARHRVHVCVPVETLSEEGQAVAPELLLHI